MNTFTLSLHFLPIETRKERTRKELCVCAFVSHVVSFSFRNDITSDDDVDLDRLTGVLPPVTSSEYFIRALVPRPGARRRRSPQLLYGCLRRGEFRMAGAFTVDKHIL